MPGLWKSHEATREGKYLVKRRDGTIPKWPYFVIAASDPAAPAALLAYAEKASTLGYDSQFVEDIRAMASEFAVWRHTNGTAIPMPPVIASTTRPRSPK